MCVRLAGGGQIPILKGAGKLLAVGVEFGDANARQQTLDVASRLCSKLKITLPLGAHAGLGCSFRGASRYELEWNLAASYLST